MEYNRYVGVRQLIDIIWLQLQIRDIYAIKDTPNVYEIAN